MKNRGRQTLLCWLIVITTLATSTGCTSGSAIEDAGPNRPQGEGWVPLFNGTSLDGWTSRPISQEDDAGFVVADGEIRQAPGSSIMGAELYTDRAFGDSELVFDCYQDGFASLTVLPRAIASMPDDDDEDQRLQLDGVWLDTDGRGWNIYSVGRYFAVDRDGVLTPETGRRPLIQTGQWNHFRVVTRGDRVQVWVNGELDSDITVHSRDNVHLQPGRVVLRFRCASPDRPSDLRWRNIYIRELDND